MKAASTSRRKPRLPETIDEVSTFLEGLLGRDESFHVGIDKSVNRYCSRISRSETYSLTWFCEVPLGIGVDRSQSFHAHSIEDLLKQFLEWRQRLNGPRQPLPSAKAAIATRPVRALEHKPARAVSEWGDDPVL
jgi:hypothetical protein